MSEDVFLLQGLYRLVEMENGKFGPAPQRRYQTPIERYFYIAFIWIVRATDGSGNFSVVFPGISPADRPLQMYPQWDFHGWPVDYMISWTKKDGSKIRIAVECDGHDFHERTKEQAWRDRSRDRHLQQEGLTIFRFTGSELYHNPVQCAVQVFNYLTDRRNQDVGK